jgi:hypothetical protein
MKPDLCSSIPTAHPKTSNTAISQTTILLQSPSLSIELFFRCLHRVFRQSDGAKARSSRIRADDENV